MVRDVYTSILALAIGMLVSALSVSAQQTGRIVTVGYLSNSSSEAPADSVFLESIRELSRAAGRETVIEARFAGAQSDQLPAMARDLVARRVDVIAAWSPLAVAAVMEATDTVPIVGLSMGDLLAVGGRPAANVTGVADLQKELQAKRVELLKESVPTIRRVAVLSNPSQPTHRDYINVTKLSAQSLGLELEVFEISAPQQLDDVFSIIKHDRADGLVVLPDGMLWAIRADIVRSTAKARIPAIYWERAYVEAGGLLSYAASLSDIARRGAVLVDKILRGARATELPVEQPTQFELVVNLKTARALGLNMPNSILLRANQLIR